jgi:hypothetical protein
MSDMTCLGCDLHDRLADPWTRWLNNKRGYFCAHKTSIRGRAATRPAGRQPEVKSTVCLCVRNTTKHGANYDVMTLATISLEERVSLTHQMYGAVLSRR